MEGTATITAASSQSAARMSQPLAGKRVLFCGYDFEEKLHRGIQFYFKSLIRVVKEAGAHTSILTSARCDPDPLVQELQILRHLDEPRRVSGGKRLATAARKMFRSPRSYCEHTFNVELPAKLAYVRYVDGFWNIPDIYRAIRIADRWQRVYTLNIPGIDMIITTSPLAIRAAGAALRITQTLHDVIPLERIDHPDNPRIFHHRIATGLKYASRGLCVSQYTNRRVAEIFPAYADKLTTTYQPAPVYTHELAEACNDVVADAVLAKYRLRKDAYFVSIGTVEPRKNVLRLVESHVATYPTTKMPLVVTGIIGTGGEPCARYFSDPSLSEQVRYLEYVPTVEKLVLLRHARALAFPTLSEGFGLPAIEAMLMGCPVITSRITSLPEVCGNHALYVDPTNTESIIQALIIAASDTPRMRALRDAGPVQAAQFSLERYSCRLIDALR